jgi:hypothetical protein
LTEKFEDFWILFATANSTNFSNFWENFPNFQYHKKKLTKKGKEKPSCNSF